MVKMKTEWQKFLELLDETFNSPLKKSDRDIIVLLGVYGEYVVNTLLKNKCSTKLEKINSQDLKLKILFELEELSDSEYDVLSKLNSVRNKYAHNLDLSSREIDSMKNSMKNITINWDEKNEEDPESLEKMFGKNPFLRFQLACITKIGYFLTKIGREKGEKINQSVIFDIRLDGKNHKFKIM